MSLYYSDFYKKLFEINNLPQWRALLHQTKEDIHFKDIEILLRSFAMLFEYEQYSSPMGKFLNTFSKKANLFKSENIDYLNNLFVSFLNSCSNLEDNVFCTKNKQFSISLFESVFVATAKPFFNERKIIDVKIVNDSVLELKEDSSFVSSNQGSVASKANVTNRITRAVTLLKFE